MGTVKKCAYKHNNARINVVRIWIVTYPLGLFTHSLLLGLGWRQDNANASGFKVPLLFGGSSKEGIRGTHARAMYGSHAEREREK